MFAFMYLSNPFMVLISTSACISSLLTPPPIARVSTLKAYAEINVEGF